MNRPAERNAPVLDSSSSRFSFHWVIRLRSPQAVTALSSHASSVCSRTSDWRKRMHCAGSSPAAISIAVVSCTFARSASGSKSTVIACRSTMQ